MDTGVRGRLSERSAAYSATRYTTGNAPIHLNLVTHLPCKALYDCDSALVATYMDDISL